MHKTSCFTCTHHHASIIIMIIGAGKLVQLRLHVHFVSW